VIFTRNRTAGLGLALAIFLADRGVKLVMSHVIRLQDIEAIPILPIFALRWMPNPGVSLGMFTAETEKGQLVLIAVTGVIAAGVLAWMLREKAKGDILALALVLGGALGNIWDRASRGYVIDYADLHFGEFRPFMIFNLADAAITIGVLILLARALLLREKPDDSADAAESPSATEKA